MDPTIIFDFIKNFGFPALLVLILLYFGWKFLGKVLNHVSGLDQELKVHTRLLQEISASLSLLTRK